MAVFYLKKRPSKRADGLRRNKAENEAFFRSFIGVSDSLRRRFRWPELFSWVDIYAPFILFINWLSVFSSAHSAVIHIHYYVKCF